MTATTDSMTRFITIPPFGLPRFTWLVYLLLPGDASPETGREYRQATRKASRVSPRLGTTMRIIPMRLYHLTRTRSATAGEGGGLLVYQLSSLNSQQCLVQSQPSADGMGLGMDEVEL